MLPFDKTSQRKSGQLHIYQSQGHVAKKLKKSFFELFSVPHIYFWLLKYFSMVLMSKLLKMLIFL